MDNTIRKETLKMNKLRAKTMMIKSKNIINKRKIIKP